jgi:prepilin peptidase CpaA
MLSPARRLMPAPPAGETGEGLRQPMPFGVPIAVAGLCVLALRINQSL